MVFSFAEVISISLAPIDGGIGDALLSAMINTKKANGFTVAR